VTGEILCRLQPSFAAALNSRDLELMQQNWANSSDTVIDNPLGGIKRGWSEIRTTYERLFESKGTYYFEFYDYTCTQVGIFSTWS
jgi:hypothetical protein